MARDPNKKIIKKIFKKAAHGHHGGAWKIAYADFVTAMMAFFLLMWLISSVTDEQKRGIADYFAPSMIKVESRAGNNGMLAGQNVMGENNSDMKGLGNNENRNEVQTETTSTFFSKNSEKKERKEAEQKKNTESSEKEQNSEKQKAKDEETQKEKQLFRDIQNKIQVAIDSNANLKKYTTNILFELTEEGLNIIITDQENKAMFPAGSYEMYDYMRDILAEISGIIKEGPNQISITGHTDSVQYASTKKYSNWELSADRANATRRALVELGIPATKFNYVKGKEATEPYDKASPTSVINRRVSVTLLHKKD